MRRGSRAIVQPRIYDGCVLNCMRLDRCVICRVEKSYGVYDNVPVAIYCKKVIFMAVVMPIKERVKFLR